MITDRGPPLGHAAVEPTSISGALGPREDLDAWPRRRARDDEDSALALASETPRAAGASPIIARRGVVGQGRRVSRGSIMSLRLAPWPPASPSESGISFQWVYSG